MTDVTDNTPTNGIISNPLLDCLIEAEKHVAAAGWEQPPRLFALVHTTRLIEMEPALATQLGTPTDPTALSSIEQEGIETAFGHGPLTDPTNLDSLLSSLAWPEEVHGVALAIERLVLPPSAAENLPTQPEKLAQAAATHPDRIEVRLMAGVTRDGQATCLLRQRAHDTDDKVAIGHDIAPDLINALSTTLVPDEE